jgi:diguanylate cyclase (GGDEF)-like protein
VPAEPVLILIVVAVLANLGVMAFVLVPTAFGRPGPAAVDRPEPPTPTSLGEAELAVALGGNRAGLEADVPTWAYDRVVRIVSWVFILASSTIVAVTGLWPDTQSAIFVLLALAGIFVLIVHDLLPTAALGPAKFVVEGSVAITFATLLIVFTGREQSPFFFVFPLIVGGAALVVSPRVTLALAAVASLGYLIALTVGPNDPLTPGTVATVSINLTALILLAYVAMVIAREQRRARDAAIRLSTVDPLTGLFNRTYFFAAVDREIARSARSGRGFCLLMMDLDELKSVNDRHGHFIGDRVLRGVGEVIRDGVRRIDTAARYGGDEFVVLLPETEVTGAYVLAEKIRMGIAELAIPGTEARTSMSVGVVSFPDDGRTSDELMISADRAMYASKHAGKNRVMGIPVGVGGTPGDSV